VDATANFSLLTKINPLFNRVMTLLQSDVLHAIIFSILYHTAGDKSVKISEMIVVSAVHLLELSLRMFELFPTLKAAEGANTSSFNTSAPRGKENSEETYMPFKDIQFPTKTDVVTNRFCLSQYQKQRLGHYI